MGRRNENTGVLTPVRSLMATLVAALMMMLAFGQPAHADLPKFPDGYPRSAPSGQDDNGYRLNFGGRHIRADLFRILTGPNSQPIRAYCIESRVSHRYDHGMKMVGWDEFPGDNAFKTDAKVRAKVAWIANNTYPQMSIEKLRATSGIAGLTEKEAISASQAALWMLTDGLSYDGVVDQVSPETANRIQQLVNYLSGPANTGLEQTDGPTVSVTGPDDVGVAGKMIGPIRVQSTASTVKVAASNYPLVDGQGKAVDPNAVPTRTDLFVKVPAGTPAGEATLSFDVTGAKYAGNLLVSNSGRAQTIVIVSSEEAHASANLSVKWNAAPTPTPSVTPTPTPSVTPTPTPSVTPTPTPSVTPTPDPTTSQAQSGPRKLPKTGA
ncbi:TQXA domain-containing protein [Propionibacterium sp. oral taxon 192 str. F0372]|nr:TQXA domain-containing protein [Propionibacterium sp. oral taxon 192 str. F0372]